MKDKSSFHFRNFSQTSDNFSFFIISRISLRSHHDTNRRAIVPFDSMLGQGPLHTSLQDRYDIPFHPHQYRLGFGISESSIELQYLRMTLMNHQARIKDSLIGSTLLFHAIDDRPQTFLDNPFM